MNTTTTARESLCGAEQLGPSRAKWTSLDDRVQSRCLMKQQGHNYDRSRSGRVVWRKDPISVFLLLREPAHRVVLFRPAQTMPGKRLFIAKDTLWTATLPFMLQTPVKVSFLFWGGLFPFLFFLLSWIPTALMLLLFPCLPSLPGRSLSCGCL